MNQLSVKFEKVCEILDKYEQSPLKLIPILQEIQEEYKYLPEEIMTFIATSLDISPAKVFGVATFYSHFTLTPKGKNIIKICDGTACHVKNSTAIHDAIKKRLELPDSQNTTPDGLFTLELVSCLGACGLAPAIVLNDKMYGPMTPESTVELVNEVIAREEGDADE